MTSYQQGACGFFLGFLPVLSAALIVKGTRDERRTVAGNFPIKDPGDVSAAIARLGQMPPVQAEPGILVRPDREPVTPTIVYARHYKDYADFCLRCRANPNSANLKFAGENEHTPFQNWSLSGYERWQHIAFVLVNPVGYYNIRGENAWSDIERMRRRNQFTRAFYYSSIRNVIPNVTDEGRPWDLNSYGAKTGRTYTCAT